MISFDDDIRAYYQNCFSSFGDSAKGVNWKNTEGQQLRLKIICDELSLSDGFSILDVGCGTGKLFSYLSAQGFKNFQYYGIDLVPEMIALAQDKFSTAKNANFSTNKLSELSKQFDYVVSSGIFNVKQTAKLEDWQDSFFTTLSMMFSRCEKAVSFNCLTNYVDFHRDDLYYSDSKEVFHYCQKNFSRHIKLNHAYPLYEYTMSIFRQNI